MPLCDLYVRFRFIALPALAAVLSLYGPVFAAYPQNHLSGKLGAKVLTSAKLTGPFKPDALLSDGPVSKGRFAFAPVDQHRTFTVDLGRQRTFDRIQLGTGGNPASVAIEVSWQSLEGPFRKVCETRNPAFFQILRLPSTTARWLRFDFGRDSDRTVVHSLRIYKGYEHPNLAEVTELLGDRIKTDIPALKDFHRQVAAGNWAAACRELRDYFVRTHKA